MCEKNWLLWYDDWQLHIVVNKCFVWIISYSLRFISIYLGVKGVWIQGNTMFVKIYCVSIVRMKPGSVKETGALYKNGKGKVGDTTQNRNLSVGIVGVGISQSYVQKRNSNMTSNNFSVKHFCMYTILGGWQQIQKFVIRWILTRNLHLHTRLKLYLQ